MVDSAVIGWLSSPCGGRSGHEKTPARQGSRSGCSAGLPLSPRPTTPLSLPGRGATATAVVEGPCHLTGIVPYRGPRLSSRCNERRSRIDEEHCGAVVRSRGGNDVFTRG